MQGNKQLLPKMEPGFPATAPSAVPGHDSQRSSQRCSQPRLPAQLPVPFPATVPQFPAVVLATVHKSSLARYFQQPDMQTFCYEIICFAKAGKSVTFATNNSGAKHNTSVVHTGCQLALCPLATCWQEGGALLDKALAEPGTLLLGGMAWFWIKLVPVQF